MKKLISKGLFLVLAVALLSMVFTGCNNNENIVKVYNWGDYLDKSILDQFTKETGIKVIYDEFDTNEDMYLKIKNMSGYSYDVLIPSDYMIKKMIDNDMLAELNFDNIPNFKNIDDKFKNHAYDPENKYSVPYMWGTVCIAYNSEKVTDPVDSWDILWNEKYKKQIFMMNSERDSIGVALMSLGYSINTKNLDELNQAKEKLIAQRPLVITYTGDDVKDKLISGEGNLAVIWSCDAGLIMQEDKENRIKFAIPKEGTNLWYDSAVILKNAKNKENAEKFINFLCREDIARKNAEYLGTTSPVTSVLNSLPDEIKNNPVLNPSAEDIEKYEVFVSLGDVAAEYERIWSDVLVS